MSRTVLGYRIQFALFVPVAGTGMEHPCTPDVIPNTEYLWCLVVERASDARSSMDLRTACVSRRLRLYLIRRDYVLLCIPLQQCRTPINTKKTSTEKGRLIFTAGVRVAEPLHDAFLPRGRRWTRSLRLVAGRRSR